MEENEKLSEGFEDYLNEKFPKGELIVVKIRKLSKEGFSQQQIAENLDISPDLVDKYT